MEMERHEYEARSLDVTALLVQVPQWHHARSIGVTMARFPEVQTHPIIERAWEADKLVAMPRIHMKSKTMQFYKVTKWDDLEYSSYDLREPIPARCQTVSPEELDLMLVPGVAFTKGGERLGLGGGFYDRYLQHYQGSTIALCFTEQLFERLPTEDHDRIIDTILYDQADLL